MGRRLRATDWSRTPLGPMERWPAALRIAVGICLGSRFPMFVWWGRELVNIYNDAYIPVLGKKHPEAFGRPAPPTWQEIWDVVGPQAELVMRGGGATWNERVLLVMERHGYTEDTWFTWSYSPIYDESGTIVGLFCACTEETPRVHAERERDRLLREVDAERARLADVFKRSPSFLAILRAPDHVFEYVNDRYSQLIAHRDVIGRTVGEALPEVVRQGYVQVLDRVAQSGEPFYGNALRVDLERAPGQPLEPAYLDFVFQPLRGADGSVERILVHGVDLTEAHLASEALRESEARFRQLADAMPQIVFAAQPDGTVDYFNRQWYEYTGLPEGATSFESWKDVHTEEGLRRVMQVWPEALRSGRPYEIEYPLRRHDGAYRWHLGRALPIRDEEGRIVRWFGTNTDIHDRKQMEEATASTLAAEQHARRESEQASRMKDEFLAMLGHELRSPLNAILGWSQILRRAAGATADVAHGSEVIERNARAQAHIIEDLLDMSGIVSGKVSLELGAVDIGLVVRTAADAARPAASAKGLAIDVGVAPLDGLHVTGDSNRLLQVLGNLLSNAVKFSAPGGRVAIEARPADGAVEISVRDEGEGIAEDFLSHVFERFRQADASTTRRHGGLGLGLAIVKQLVEMHGGAVRAESDGPGRGARFVVSLPVRAERPEAGRARTPESPGAPASIAGLRVLVVDDDADARELVQRVLEEAGARVAAAASASEAYALLRDGRFHLLLSDIGMPGEDGYSLIRRVRGLAAAADIPAVALTAYTRAEDRALALRAGFQGHVGKPVNAALLLAAVSAAVASSVPGIA